MRIMRLSVILLCVLIAAPAYAVIYEWIDNNGVVGFTEDLGSIPQKYRKKARVLGQEDTPVAPEVDSSKKKKEPASEPAAPASRSVDNSKKKTFGGKDEAYWSEEFAKARYELKSIRDQIEAINARLSNTGQMSRSEFKSLESSKKLYEEQESAAQKRMDKLKDAAGKAGVPPDLR